MDPITSEEIKSVLKSKQKSATGTDGYSGKDLRRKPN